MKIHKVSFRNLNSLRGEWSIDFTHPQYAEDGIFLIGGPTGAGKTTLLDAICLALYGRTPRLARINAKENEIMSRQTAECSAEVVFSNSNGLFRCHWSQHRARKKPGGNLSQPKREISEASGEKLLESQTKKVEAAVERETGMDFDMFTRSMLLAQGAFAAFLQASPDERSPLLEQITGTEIYTRISKKVHERFSEEGAKLKNLQNEATQINLPLPGEMEQLDKELQELTDADETLNKETDTLRKMLEWKRNLEELQKSLSKTEEDREKTQKEKIRFAPLEKKLNAALRALELEPARVSLEALRQRQTEIAGELADREAEIRLAKSSQQSAADEFNQRHENLNRLNGLWQEQKPLFQKTREIDQKLAACQKNLNGLLSRKEVAEGNIREEQSQKKVIAARLQDLQQKSEQTADYLKEHADNARLGSELAALKVRHENWVRMRANLTEIEKKRTANHTETEQLTRLLESQTQASEAAEQGKNDLTAKIRELSQTHLELKAGRETEDWRRERESLAAQSSVLQDILALEKTLNEKRETQSVLKKEKEAVLQTLSRLKGELETSFEFLEISRSRLDALEKNVELENKFISLASERKALQRGTPCPLCGSEEHPWAGEYSPNVSQTRRERDDAKRKLTEAETRHNEILRGQTAAEKDRQKFTEAWDSLQTKIGECQERRKAAIWKISELSGTDLDKIDFFQRLENLKNQKTEIESRIDQLDSLKKQLDGLYSSQQKVLEEAAQITQETQSRHSELRESKSKGQDWENQIGELTQTSQKASEELAENIRFFLGSSATGKPIDDLSLLEKRAEEYKRQTEHADQLQKQLLGQESLLQNSENFIAKYRTDLAGIEKEREPLEAETEDLWKTRRELFENRNPDAEESALQSRIRLAEETLGNARNALEKAKENSVRILTEYQGLQNEQGRIWQELEAAEKNFLESLKSHAFNDEEDFKNACMEKTEREELAKEQRRLNDQSHQLDFKLEELKGTIETEAQKANTEKNPDDLKAELEKAEEGQRENREKIGSLREKKDAYEKVESRFASKSREIENQKSVSDQWKKLHDLIGSSDGKKFRNFAQGLTFDQVVFHANRELVKLNNRYLLARDGREPLELKITDHFQAGEIRSSRNLSGGESFLVSLALALGLSKITGQNMRVDSLFLDEGFGTLDEDALEIALEALSNLHQEGKLIGIISHVGQLKERLRTQIQVRPQSGGTGKIIGPGCQSLGN